MPPESERRQPAAQSVGDMIVRVCDGETITEQERRNVVLLAERDAMSMTWSRYAPGERGPDLHVHREHTDAFYVLEGELTFALGPAGERIRMSAGGCVAVPPNVAHSFSNDSSEDTRWLNVHAPDKGFAAYLRALRDGADAAFDSFDPPADGGLPAGEAIVARPGGGEQLRSGDRVVSLKAVLPDLCVTEWVLDGPEPHLDDRRVDAMYVLEGELDVRVEDTVQTAGPDTLVCVLEGVQHAFARSGAKRARVLTVHAPDGGVADFLRRVSKPAVPRG